MFVDTDALTSGKMSTIGPRCETSGKGRPGTGMQLDLDTSIPALKLASQCIGMIEWRLSEGLVIRAMIAEAEQIGRDASQCRDWGCDRDVTNRRERLQKCGTAP